MTKWVAAGLATGAAAIVALVLVNGPEPSLTLADPDCPRDAPVMAIDLYGDLRQDDVAVIHRDGRVERLTREHASWGASFSPDGRELVFTSGREGFHEECCGFSDHEIYVMNSDGTKQRRLMQESNNRDTSPDWSPDGSLIAFVRDGTELMVAPPTGEDLETIFSSKAEIDDLAWSPDGERIAFLTRSDLYVLERDAGEAESLAEDLGYAAGLAWSPDGSTLAFTADFSVYTASLEEPNPRLFARDSHTPAWSPDGRFLAYYFDDEANDVLQIVTQPVDGDQATPLQLSKESIYSFATNLDWLDCRA